MKSHFIFIVFPLLFFFAGCDGKLLHGNHRHRLRRSSPSDGGPDIFFEVARPVGEGTLVCSTLVLQHSFANTYSVPPAVANYSGPPCSSKWDQVVLKWSGTCKGRQYDRIAAVWFGGVEVLRTCTAEPTSRGIYWEVRKDVSRFASVFRSPQIVAVELANVVTSTYTGIFNINITLEFYRSGRSKDKSLITDVQDKFSVSGLELTGSSSDVQSHGRSKKFSFSNTESSVYSTEIQGSQDKPFNQPLVSSIQLQGSPKEHHIESQTISSDVLADNVFSSDQPADLVIPIASSDPLDGGYWFDISSENDTASYTFQAPTNIYRAVLEICVSFHGNDEFWYTNPPNEYLEANKLSGYPGNGPFREVQVFLDDYLVGAVWPFPVIFTGGVNPLYWRPAAAIGAYNLPSYDIELTPFIGLLVDGSIHTISLRVKNADGSWPLDANLHLWLDPLTSQTLGGLLSYDATVPTIGGSSQFEGLDGIFQTTAQRSISFSGYVISTLGDILTTASYTFSFDNTLVYENDSAVQIVKQEIQMKGEIVAKSTSKVVFSHETTSSFPFYLYCADYSGANSSYTEECNLTHSFDQEISTVSLSSNEFESLSNWQAAGGNMTVVKSTVTAGVGTLSQNYDFDSTGGCFQRTLSTKNYSVLFDATDFSCEPYVAQL